MVLTPGMQYAGIKKGQDAFCLNEIGNETACPVPSYTLPGFSGNDFRN